MIISGHRILAAAVLLAMLCASTLLISRVTAHYHSGSAQIKKTMAAQDILESHNPNIFWKSDAGTPYLNQHLRTDMAKAYGDAWGILSLSMAAGRDLGLNEHFTDRYAEHVRTTLMDNSQLLRTCLSHKLQLHFMSLDHQIVSLTDHQHVSEVTIMDAGYSYERTDTSAYKVIMILEDGKWRINKLSRIGIK